MLIATLTPASGEKPDISLCLVCGERGLADVLLNVILYAPLGAGIALCGWRPRALLAPALLSASIETAQIWIPGRDPSLGDVTFNALGAVMGFALVRSSVVWLAPGPRLRSIFASGAAAGAVAVMVTTGVLLRMDLPRSIYWSQWTPDLGHLEWYRGRILRATLGRRNLPGGRLEQSDQVRTLLLSRASLVIRAVAGPRVPALASLFSIADGDHRQIILLGPDRDDLVLRYRTVAVAAGLDEPDLRAIGVMQKVVPGDPLKVEVQADSRGYALVMNGQRSGRLGFTPGRAWAVLYYPESLPEWLRRLLDDALVALLLLPLGFWVTGDRLGGSLIFAVIAGIIAVPAVTGLLSMPPAEIVGAVAGFAVGLSLRGVVAARAPIPGRAAS